MPYDTFQALKNYAKRYVYPWNENLADRAFELAHQGHQNHFRMSGEMFIFHPLAVAHYVAGLRCDMTTFLAAILHDVVEDTPITLSQISDEFGEEVGSLVFAVTRAPEPVDIDNGESTDSHIDPNAQSVRKAIVGIARDIRVAYIKLSDRWHNLVTLEGKPPERRKRTLLETTAYYIPLAQRLGIGQIHRDLESWLFRFDYPGAYSRVQSILPDLERKYRQQLDQLKHVLDDRLRDKGVACDIIEAPLESILLRKAILSNQDATTDKTTDDLIYPLQAIMPCETAEQCYSALCVIHLLWPPISQRFEDCLGFPLPDGYSGLRTQVQIQPDKVVEFQLQTLEGYQTAEFGPLHLLRHGEDFNSAYMRSAQAGFLNQIIEADRLIQSTREFLEYLQIDVLKPRLRVFLHDSGVFHVLAGATILDAAFARDSKIGFRCSGAIVNGQRVPVSWVLNNGDLVQFELADKDLPVSVEQFGRAFTALSTKYTILCRDRGEVVKGAAVS